MRNRVSTTEGRCTPNFTNVLQQNYVNDTFPPYRLDTVIDTSNVTFTKESSNISDELLGPPQEVYVDPITGRWRRHRRSRSPAVEVGVGGGLMRSQLKPVHRCEHLKVKVTPVKDVTVALQSHDFAGNYLYDRYTTNTLGNLDGVQLINRFKSVPTIDGVLTGSAVRWTAGDYIGHDWFALTSRFNEACDQFIHSSTLIGESIIENAIFVDAFKLVINPTSAIQALIKLGLRFKRARKMNLGQMSKKLLKGSANANLFYQFGIKPAISDIQDAFNAHHRVSERMKILRTNAGRYIPIRVRDETFSPHSNEPLETADLVDFQWTLRHKMSRATLGAWGRVRSDLQFNDTWSAYLQYFGINKIAGLAWELVPFSFVVDWFTNTQERINQYTRDRTGGPFTDICNIWSSVKQEQLEELNVVPGRISSMPTTYMINPSVPTAVVERLQTYYTRYPYIPDTSGIVDFSDLGLFHAVTTGSLIIQRWR